MLFWSPDVNNKWQFVGMIRLIDNEKDGWTVWVKGENPEDGYLVYGDDDPGFKVICPD